MGKARILIVEDNPLVSLDVSQTLTEFGYDIIGVVDTGEEAVRVALHERPQFILMDVNLKDEMDGIQAAQKIHDAAEIPVVFLTALTDEETLQRAKLTQPYGFLIKPFDPAELRSTIELTLFRFETEKAKGGTASELHWKEPEESIEIGPGQATDRLRVLSALELLHDVPPALLDSLAQSSTVKQFEAGEYLILEDGESGGGFIPLSGRISILKTTTGGKDLIVSLLGPGDSFGLFFTLNNFVHTCAARAQMPSRALWIPRPNFLNICAAVPSVYGRLCEELAKRLTLTYQLAASLAHTKVETRIVNTLATLLPTFGRATASVGGTEKQGERIYMTRKELADLTGTTPETAIRVTKSLERDGLLDLSRPGIIKILDVPALTRYAQEGN